MPAKVILFWQSKGGVTKTSTAVEVSSETALRGHKVLAIDWDHNNPGLAKGLMNDQDLGQVAPNMTSVRIVYYPERGVREITYSANLDLNIKDGVDGIGHRRYPLEVVHQAEARGYRRGGCLDLVPADRDLQDAIGSLTLSNTGGAASIVPNSKVPPHMRLRTALQAAREQYDFIFIDCPPERPPHAIGIENALYAADYLIMPCPLGKPSVQACVDDFFALQNFNDAERKHAGLPPLEVLGIAITKFKGSSNKYHDMVLGQLTDSSVGQYVFNAKIPFNDTIVEEAEFLSIPPQLLDAQGWFAGAVQSLTQEVLARVAR